MHKRFKDGFTLVELLVVIAVIAILSTIGIVSYTIVTTQSRDSRRQSDIAALSHALEAFYQTNSEYPAGCLTVVSATSPCVTYTSSGTSNNDPSSFTTANSTQINANITIAQLQTLLPKTSNSFGDPLASTTGTNQLFLNNSTVTSGQQNYAYAGGITNATSSVQTYYVAWSGSAPLGCSLSVTLQPGQTSSYVTGYLSEVDHTWHLRSGAHGVAFQSSGGSGNNLSCGGSLYAAQWAQ